MTDSGPIRKDCVNCGVETYLHHCPLCRIPLCYACGEKESVDAFIRGWYPPHIAEIRYRVSA